MLLHKPVLGAGGLDIFWFRGYLTSQLGCSWCALVPSKGKFYFSGNTEKLKHPPSGICDVGWD